MTKEEAINKVRQMSLPKETMEILEALAPELAESEDERIRKELLAVINDLVLPDEQKARFNAWLEKQKEQKPKLYWHKIKAYEKLPCKAYIYKQAFEQENNFFGKATIPGFMAPNIPCGIGCDTWYLPVDDIKNLPKEGEDEQKPAEWSEEEENKIESIKALITTGRFADTNTIRTIWELLDSLSPQPKQEWSEEDEKKIIFLERLIEHNVPDGQYGWADGRKGGFVTKSEAISMLKSLRPQPKRDCKDCAMFLNGECTKPSWKPSKEQMKALLNAEGYLREGDQFDSAKSIAQLYEQLKKL